MMLIVHVWLVIYTRCFQHCPKWNPAKLRGRPTWVCQTCGKSKEDHITFATFFNKANWSKINTKGLLDQESVESFWDANDKYIIDDDSKILLYQKYRSKEFNYIEDFLLKYEILYKTIGNNKDFP